MNKGDKFINHNGTIIEYLGLEKRSNNYHFIYRNSFKEGKNLIYTPDNWEREKIFSVWQPYKD